MSNHNRRGQILIDLLKLANGGPVSVEIIRGVVWPDASVEPEDWIETLRHLVYTAGPRLGVPISAVTRFGFVGYRVDG